jgi:hypothetical protein
MSFTNNDLQYVVALCQHLQHPAFGTAGKWLNFHAPDANIESADEENDTIDTPNFTIQAVHEEEDWFFFTRMATRYVVSVPKVISGSFMEPDDIDLREIGDASGLSDAVLLAYQYACEQVFCDAVQAFEYNREKEAA